MRGLVYVLGLKLPTAPLCNSRNSPGQTPKVPFTPSTTAEPTRIKKNSETGFQKMPSTDALRAYQPHTVPLLLPPFSSQPPYRPQ